MTPSIVEGILAVSGSLAAAILVKVTVTMALALVLVRLARGSRAAVRHAVLAAAFGAILALPAASILAPPIRIALRDRIASPPLAAAIGAAPRIGSAAATVRIPPAPPRPSAFSPSAFLMAAWLAGAMLSLLPLVLGLRQVRRLRRSGLPWRRGESIAEALARETGVRRRVNVLVHEALPGPMTCGLVRPAIILSPDAPAWTGEELNRALVHELEHVRRGDWLSQCLARAVCALYWFHPLVWMAWRRLELEAERSCDDAVLERSEATAYADQLVGLARRLTMAARSPSLAMANRTDLAERVRAVLDSRRSRGRAGMLPVALVCAGAALLVVAVSPLTMIAAPQSSAGPTAQFDAVSVKLIDPDAGTAHSHERQDPKRLAMTGSAHRFIRRAYGLTDGQLGGEPDWFKNRLYSVEAVTSAPATEEQMMLMLRSVLASRFQLRLKEESREMPAYSLEVAPGGPKFKELKTGEVPQDAPEPEGIFARTFTSMDELMNSLNGVYGGRLNLDRPVVDRTSLTGHYNMQLRTEIETVTDDFGRRSLQFPNLFHDMQSELGLRLVPVHVSMPYFVVEHAAEPAPN